ncbi:methyltransferase domain-containing protein, partial [Azospirillum sp.]|uniref:methyltransferase domain-containing protein n=1 Tax=Azospirillum sp. TaxID=34012 RepID=UPI002D7037E7
AGFTRHLEAAYQTMWRIHAAGEPPRPFAAQPAETRPVPDAAEEERTLTIDVGTGVLRGWLDRERAPQPAADFVVPLGFADDYRLPVEDGSVDRFVLDDVLQCVAQPLTLFQELHRIARPGARMTVRVPHGGSDAAWSDAGHVRAYFPTSFLSFAQGGPRKGVPSYRGDWRLVRVAVTVAAEDIAGLTAEDAAERVRTRRNVARDLIAELEAVKPMRGADAGPDPLPRMDVLPA